MRFLVLSCLASAALAAPNFTKLTPASPPTNRRSCGGALQSGATDTFVCYGGFSGGGTLAELIDYKTASNAWSAVSSVLPARERHALGYDPLHDVFVVFGGASGATLFDTVHLIKGSNLSQSTPPTPLLKPSARIDAAMQWIPPWGKFLMFGGRTSVFANQHVNDTWTLDVGDGGVTWSSVVIATGSPTVRGAACSAWDPDDGVVLLFGGEGSSNVADTWSFSTDGGAWKSLTVTGTVPSARGFAGCAWDAKLKQLVLYGGQTSTQVGGLFSFNPATNVWTSWTPASSPGALSDTSAAYSPGLGGILFFGGQSGTAVYVNDTWLLTFNLPPVVDAGPNFSIGESAPAMLSGRISDPDGDPTTLSWAQTLGPAVALANPSTLTPSFTTPSVLVATPLKFVLTGSDLTQSASAEVTVTVLNSIDEKPFADAGPAQTVNSGQAVTLSGSGTDPNGDPIVSYAWQQLTGPAASLSSSSVASPSFTAPIVAVATVLRFQLAVGDGTLVSDPVEAPITVMPVAMTDGGADAGTDAGMDAGVLDGGLLDGGLVDGGLFDGGADGGSLDAGSADAGADDAGLVADAGNAPGDLDGGVATARVLGVGCGCTQAPPVAWLLALAWWLRRRDPRAR